VVSIGGGTTGVAIFVDGRPIRLSVIPIGGDHITNDLAYVAKIPISVAEELKKRLSLEPPEEDEEFEVVIRGKAKTMPIDALVEVVSCRLEELFSHHVKEILDGMNYHAFPSGIILTGGVALTEGLEGFVSDVMALPVRVGVPIVSHQMPPGMSSCQYSSLAGIVRYLVERDRHRYRYIETSIGVLRGGGYTSREPSPRRVPSFGEARGVFDSIKRAFKDLF
jgi:cell division protein FtsA